MTAPAPQRLPCPVCRRPVGTGFGGVRLMPHKHNGEPCAGSRTPVADLPTSTAAPTAETGA